MHLCDCECAPQLMGQPGNSSLRADTHAACAVIRSRAHHDSAPVAGSELTRCRTTTHPSALRDKGDSCAVPPMARGRRRPLVVHGEVLRGRCSTRSSGRGRRRRRQRRCPRRERRRRIGASQEQRGGQTHWRRRLCMHHRHCNTYAHNAKKVEADHITKYASIIQNCEASHQATCLQRPSDSTDTSRLVGQACHQPWRLGP